MSEFDGFCRIGGVAKILDCSPRSVYREIRNGELRAIAINGRGDYRVHVDWIREYADRKAATTAAAAARHAGMAAAL